MTREKLLQKIIKKAEKNGYDGYKLPRAIPQYESDVAKAALLTKLMREDFLPMIIFRHDFAKAFWGEKIVDETGSCVREMTPKEIQDSYPTGCVHISSNKTLYRAKDLEYMIPCWQFHLQIAVLEEDPISYLEKFL